MKLISLHIHNGYNSDDTYRGSVSFTSSHGKVELVLDQEMSEKVVAVVAEQIVESAKTVAEAMNASFVAELEAPSLVLETAPSDEDDNLPF